MLGIYDNVQEELKAKDRLLNREKDKVNNAVASTFASPVPLLPIAPFVACYTGLFPLALQVQAQQREIEDLQEEFEFDRNDYLDTIRKQEQEMKWLKSVIDKVHPCLRRDSNYVNLDRIRAHSQWDEDNQMWAMPKMMIEKTKLPPAGECWNCLCPVFITLQVSTGK